MQVKSNVGVWIDNRKAVIVSMAHGYIDTQVIYSGEETTSQSEGIRIKKKPRIAEDLDPHTQINDSLKKFFKFIAKKINNAHAIYILGPAEAKLGLEKTINEESMLHGKVIGVETCDYLTENQLVEHVKDFFYHREGVSYS